MPGREDVFQKAMNQGHSAAWDQAWDKAAACYEAALREFPDNPKALNSLALAQFQMQHFDQALGTYKRVAILTPEDPVPVEKIAQLSERTGDIPTAVVAANRAAELYLKTREVEKAIENWTRVTQLDPNHLAAHSRLAMVYEKLNQPGPAVAEYIALASLVQHGGNPGKAAELIDHALQISPNSTEAKQAKSWLKSGQMLPKPVRPKGGTGPLRMAQVRELQAPGQAAESTLDPISEARAQALEALADLLFELTDDSPETQSRRGLQSLTHGTGKIQHSDQARILLHLSQAIDSQTKGHESQAAEELEHALEAGCDIPALHFDLGYLRSRGERLESALRHLQQCIRHDDYGLAARLLSGQVYQKMGKPNEAALENLEALKLADSAVVPPEQADSLRQLYEPLLEAQQTASDEQATGRLSANIQEMLVRSGWRSYLVKARGQLPKTSDGSALPLAEVLIQAQSSHVLEAMNQINQLARDGRLRSAMDEAFLAVIGAPTYLPLHTLIGEVLIREGRTQDAITKFGVVAHAYGVRGEAGQATHLLRRILQLAPMDMSVRTQLIDQLTARGQVDEAISEYIELADIYYRLAELDLARKTYTTALRLAQQSGANRQWSSQILHRMADIDVQRLDWRQALRVYEQIRTLRPDDEPARKQLVELNLRLGQPEQAVTELDAFTSYLEGAGRGAEALTFVEHLVAEQGEQVILRRALAEQYRKAGRPTDAIAQLDAAGEALMQAGDKQGVIDVLNQILRMNPPNAAQYRELIAQLGG
jgi:tetratricopeptide (TPR) repeat protein